MKTDQEAPKPNETLKWIATSFITISVLMLSFSLELALTWWTYLGFLAGHCIWAVQAHRMKEWSMFTLSVLFIFVNFYAMYIRA